MPSSSHFDKSYNERNTVGVGLCIKLNFLFLFFNDIQHNAVCSLCNLFDNCQSIYFLNFIYSLRKLKKLGKGCEVTYTKDQYAWTF